MVNKSQVDIKSCFHKGVKPEIDQDYLLNIDNETYVLDNHLNKGLQLMQLTGKNYEDFFLLMLVNGGKKVIKPNDEVDLINDGIERFVTVPKHSEVIDIEDCFKKGVLPVVTLKYIIKINGDKITVDKHKMNGREILALVNKTPENSFLRQKTKDGRKLIEADEIVDFTECGIERFITQARSCTEGFVHRRDFVLPQGDVEFLNNSRKNWETLSEGNQKWLIIRDHEIPDGYNVTQADIALLFNPAYPVAQLDMIWFSPALNRADEQPINALAPQEIEGKSYQRWSRHRDGSNPWQPGEDNVESHLQLMLANLELEFKKR